VTAMAATYSELPNELVSAPNGIDYAPTCQKEHPPCP